MAKAPFFRVYIADKDISTLVESFKYEDCLEEDNLLVLSIKDDYVMSLSDDDSFKSGTIVSFQFGFLGEEISELHKARVTDISYKYRDKVTMSVKCLDIGTKVKKVTTNKIWRNKTSTQIASEIANKYGLTTILDTTDKVWDNLPQGNRSDFHFLKYLAQREQDGNYIMYIRNSNLFFVKRSTDKHSILTFTYGDGNGIMLSFEPTLKESSTAGASNKTVVPVFDAIKGEHVPTVVDKKTEVPTGTLGKFKRGYQEITSEGKLGAIVEGSKDTTEVEETIIDPTQDNKEATNIGNSKKKAAVLKSLIGKLVLEGQPVIVPNTVITIKGVTKKHTGNWYVIKVTHDIKSSGFVTTLDLNKNGTNIGSTNKTVGTSGVSEDKATDSNESIGEDKVADTVSIVTVNSEGKIV